MSCPTQESHKVTDEAGSTSLPARKSKALIPIYLLPKGMQSIASSLIGYTDRESYVAHLGRAIAGEVEGVNNASQEYKAHPHVAGEMDEWNVRLRLARQALAEKLLVEWGFSKDDLYHPSYDNFSEVEMGYVRQKLIFKFLFVITDMSKADLGITPKELAVRLTQHWPEEVRLLFDSDQQVMIGPHDLDCAEGIQYALENQLPVPAEILARYPELILQFGF